MVDVRKTVLVQLQTPAGNRNRPVAFSGGPKELLLATKEKFKDVLTCSEVYLQIQDDSWGGEFVDLLIDQDIDIPSRATIRAVEIVSILNVATLYYFFKNL